MRTSLYSILIIFALLSCAESNKMKKMPASLSDLIGTTWTLNTLNGTPVDASDFMKGLPSMEFTEDKGLQGSTGCNSFSGNFKISGDEVKLTPGAMSKMACPGTGEADFLNALARASSILMDGESLILNDSGKKLMRFNPSKD